LFSPTGGLARGDRKQFRIFWACPLPVLLPYFLAFLPVRALPDVLRLCQSPLWRRNTAVALGCVSHFAACFGFLSFPDVGIVYARLHAWPPRVPAVRPPGRSRSSRSGSSHPSGRRPAAGPRVHSCSDVLPRSALPFPGGEGLTSSRAGPPPWARFFRRVGRRPRGWRAPPRALRSWGRYACSDSASLCICAAAGILPFPGRSSSPVLLNSGSSARFGRPSVGSSALT